VPADAAILYQIKGAEAPEGIVVAERHLHRLKGFTAFVGGEDGVDEVV
jgi:hypothetical protein